jgi:chromosome segregation ATPase
MDNSYLANELSSARQKAEEEAKRVADIQKQLDKVTSDLAGSRKEVQDLQATSQATITSNTNMINNLNAQVTNCSAQDYTSINNLLNTHAQAMKQNTTLVKSISIQDNVKRLEDLQQQNVYLKQEKADLIASIEQHERDFIDMREALPEVLPNTSIHTLDDYTLWILVMSYSLFVISVIFYYCYINGYTMNAILISTVSAALLTMFLFILMILLL